MQGTLYTLMEMHTDLTAVPHAILRHPHPESSRKALKGHGAPQEEMLPQGQDRGRRTGRSYGGRSCLQLH